MRSSEEGGLPTSAADSGRDGLWEGGTARAALRKGVCAGEALSSTAGGAQGAARRLGLTVSGHAKRQTFLQAAVLASVPASAVDGAVLLTGAGVGHVTVLAPAEEALGTAGGDQAATPARPSSVLVPSASSPQALTPAFPDPTASQFSLLHFLA